MSTTIIAERARQLAGERTYDLTYVDYRDDIDNDGETIRAVIEGDFEAVFERIDDAYDEQRYLNAVGETDGLIREAVGDLYDEGVLAPDMLDGDRDDFIAAMLEEIRYTEDYDDVRHAVEDRDTSDPVGDVLRNSGEALIVAHVEETENVMADDYEDDEAVLEILRAVGLPATDRNVSELRQAGAEVASDFGSVAVMFALGLDEIFALPWNTATVTVDGPSLLVGNHLMGATWATEPLEGSVTLRRDELRWDGGPSGYGWEGVAGCYVSAYSATLAGHTVSDD